MRRGQENRQKLTSWCTLAVAVAILGACGEPRGSAASPALMALAPGDVPSGQMVRSDVVDAISAIGTTPLPPTTSPVAVPLEVVGGTFLGIGPGSSLAHALQTLGVKPVFEPADAFDTCSALPSDRWVMYANGLTLVFEGTSAETARMTSWQYTGGPAAGFTEIVAPEGVTVGGTRQDVLAAYDEAVDVGGSIEVNDPVYLRFGLDHGSIAWFGSLGC